MNQIAKTFVDVLLICALRSYPAALGQCTIAKVSRRPLLLFLNGGLRIQPCCRDRVVHEL